MQEFSLVHLSDIHLKGDGTSGESRQVDLLFKAVRKALNSAAKPHILLLGGDLVDAPSTKSFEAAQRFLDTFTPLFDHVFVIPGNHDVKQLWGTFFNRKKNFESKFASEGSLLLPNVGLHLIGADSTSTSTAHGRISQEGFDELIREYYLAEETQGGLSTSLRETLIRVVAVHHHPLPLAQVEGIYYKNIIREEDFVYFKNPAQFMEACLDCDVSMILHGHRHVQGLARYSIPSSSHRSRSEPARSMFDDSWENVYVLSAPSALGHGADAGFNVLEFKSSSDASYVEIGRFSRKRNQGLFEPMDANQPNDKLRITFAHQIVWDQALDIESKLTALPTNPPDVAEAELMPLASQLFRRRAFMALPERHWGQLLYALMKTRLVWNSQVQPRLLPKRRDAGNRVSVGLVKMEEIVSYEIFGMDDLGPDDFRIRYINDKADFLHYLPYPNIDQAPNAERKRGRWLDDLKKNLQDCGIAVDGFSQALGGYDEE